MAPQAARVRKDEKKRVVGCSMAAVADLFVKSDTMINTITIPCMHIRYIALSPPQPCPAAHRRYTRST